MRKTILFVSSILMFSFLFTGCVQKMERVTIEEDRIAKEFKTDPELSNLYICRNETFGGAVLMPVIVNDKLIGKTEAKSFFYLQLEPGRHKIQSLTEQTQTLYIDTVKNKNYFIWQEVKWGTWVANSALHSLSEEEGKKCVLTSNMLKIEK